MKKADLERRMKQVRLVVFDVDGVLTDGSILIGADGGEIKAFNVHDGSGIKYLQRAGIGTAILSGRSSPAVDQRAKELDIPHVFQGCRFKVESLAELVNASKVSPRDMCFIGDDLPDIPVMREVGLAVSVPNARPEVKRIAHLVTRAGGGHGAVREVAERLLRAQRKWGRIVARYGLRGSGGAKRGAL